MKLRNKKTGEIKNFALVIANGEVDDMTIAELECEWEDYEETKEQFYLDCDGRIFENHTTDYIKSKMQEIGNYFETREEAEKAVEKLKAWKRLKDKGYYFRRWKIDKLHFEIELRVKEYDFVTDELKQDLNLLFGGEE